MELVVNEEETFLFDPQISLHTGINLAGLAEIISNRFDADCEGEQKSILRPPPNRPILVHHPRSICLLVVLQNAVVVPREEPWHDVVDLPTLQLSPIIAEYFFASQIDLVHDATVFPIKL